MPLGEDERYDDVVRERNAELLSGGSGIPLYDYRVGDVYQTVLDLDASISALSRRGRVVVVPLGPKPLALAAMIVASAHTSDVTVWRMSAGSARLPEDRPASGSIVGVSVQWPAAGGS